MIIGLLAFTPNPFSFSLSSAFTVQALVLNFAGAVYLAIPDIPRLAPYASSSALRQAWTTLDEKGEVTNSHRGFDKLIDILDEHTQRIHEDRDYIKLKKGPTRYGNPNILARRGKDHENAGARRQLAEWLSLTMWVNQRRDSVRVRGLFLLVIGFLFQLVSFIISSGGFSMAQTFLSEMLSWQIFFTLL